MIMYIPEFWCGVILTVLLELIVVFVMSMFVTMKDRKEKRRNGQK